MLPCLLALLALSCTERVDEAQEQPAERTIRVAVGSGPRLDIESRTALADDGRKVVWSTDDAIALWAFDGEGAAALNGHGFRLWHYNAEYDNAKFTADIPEMAEGSYDYCAFYPVPDAAGIDGSHVSYTVPAVQSGRYDPASDIMTAHCTGGALVEGDNSDRVQFAFAHKVHLLEFTVPTCALGEAVKSIELEFPVAVAGRLTFDAADAAAEPELTEGSNRLSLRFDEPIEPGAKAYALIAPVEIPADQPVAIRAVGTTGESRTDTFGAGRRFAAGGVTPIEYNIPEMELHYTIIDFTLANDGRTPNVTLGEPVRTCTLSVDGGTFDNGLAMRSFALADVAASASGERTFRMIFREFNDNLSGKTVTVTYDSQHAVVSDSFTMPQLAAGATNSAAKLEVPYLFEEDFSSLSTSAASDDNPGVGGTTVVSGDRTGVDLSQWGLATEGWTAARVGVQAGGSSNGAVRICARVENQQIAQNTYKARMDSAPFSHIRPEITGVSVRVSYNYKGGRYSIVRKNLFGGDGGSGNGDAVYEHGYTTEPGWQGGSVAIPNIVGGTMTIPGTSGADRNENQTYDDISHENSFVIPNATASTRASWSVSSTMSNAPIAGANGNFWLYIDNVRVSIVNE